MCRRSRRFKFVRFADTETPHSSLLTCIKAFDGQRSSPFRQEQAPALQPKTENFVFYFNSTTVAVGFISSFTHTDRA